MSSKKIRSKRKPRRFAKTRLEQLEGRVMLTTVTWNLDRDGFWDEPSNWLDENGSERVPGFGDEVIIDREAGDFTVTLRDAQRVKSLASAERVVLDGASLQLDGSSSIDGDLALLGGSIQARSGLSLNGETEWVEGSLIGSFINNGVLTTSGDSDKVLDGLTNNGHFILDGAGSVQGLRQFIDNQPNAVWEFRSDASLVDSPQPGGPTFNNRGTVRKSGGGGESRIGLEPYDVSFNNLGGRIEVQTGILYLNGGSSRGGSYSVAKDSILDLTGGNSSATYEGIHTGTGEGRIQFGSGTITNGGDGMTMDFSPGLFHWTGGTFTAETMTNIGEWNISGDSTKKFHRVSVHNAGTVIHSDSGNVDFCPAGGCTVQLNILPVGIYEIRGDGGSVNAGAINVQGILRKSEGIGESRFDGTSLNLVGGTIEAQSGQLTMTASKSTGGVFQVGADSVVDLTGGSSASNFQGNYSGIGEGQVQWSSGTLNTSGAGATFDFPEGMLNWTGGEVRSAVTRPFQNVGFLTLSGLENKVIQHRSHFLNAGVVIQEDLGHIDTAGSLPTVTNLPDATWDLRDDNGFFRVNFVNQGTLRKSGGSGEANFSQGTFSNRQGVIEVESGTLVLAPNSGTNTGGGRFNVDRGAILELRTTTNSHFAGNYSGSGDGNVLITGSFVASDNDPTIFNFPDNYLKWIGAPAPSFGSLVNQGSITLEGAGHYDFRGSFVNNGVVHQNGDGAFKIIQPLENNGIWDLRSNGNIDLLGARATIYNHGTLRKSAGLGTSSITRSSTSIRVSTAFDNHGVVEVRSGSIMVVGNVGQLDGNKLTGGTWIVGPGSSMDLVTGEDIRVNEASIVLQGEDSAFAKIDSLEKNVGSLAIQNGRKFTTDGFLVNSGSLTVGAGSTLSVNGTFDHSGSLNVQIAERPSTGQHGRIHVAETAALVGDLTVELLDGFGPSSGDEYQIMTQLRTKGEFSQIAGLEPFFDASLSDTSFTLTTRQGASDLSITAIDIPTEVTVGEELTLSYTVRNLSGNGVSAVWTDSLYLSEDDRFDSSDKLITRVRHTRGVSAHGLSEETSSVPTPGVREGDYYVVVVADSRGLVADTDRSNNRFVSSDTVNVQVSTLSMDEIYAGTIADGQSVYLRLDTPSTGDVRLTALFSEPLQAEFVTRQSDLPDRSNFDQSANDLNQLDRSIILSSPGATTHYILLHGRAAAATGTRFELIAEPISFAVEQIQPVQMGNAGEVTLTVHGAGFSDETTVELLTSTGRLRATRQLIPDGNTLQVTFDVSSLEPADYEIQISSPDEQPVRQTVTVVEGVKGELSASLAFTPARIGRPFRGTISFENTGDADIPLPLLIVQAPEGAMVWPRGASKDDATDNLQFLGIPADGPHSGVIAPGQRGEIRFNAVTNVEGDFELSSVPGNSPEGFDSKRLEKEIAPTDPTPYWSKSFRSVTSHLDQYADYLRLLTSAAIELNPSPFTIGELLEFLVEKQHVETAQIVGQLTVDAESPPQTVVSLSSHALEHAITARSLPNGRFGFAHVPAGTFELAVNGYIVDPALRTVNVQEEPHDIGTIHLNQGAKLHGRVTSQSGDPVTDAVVSVHSRKTSQFTRTDQHGWYELTGIESGVASVDVHSRGVWVQQFGIDFTKEETIVQNVVVNDGGNLNGMIRSSAGTAVTDVRVELVGPDSELVAYGATNGRGEFSIHDIRSGRYEIKFVKPGFAELTISDVHVGNNAQTMNIDLEEAGTVHGIVIDEDTGSPIPNALILSAMSVHEASGFLTDDGGAFSIPDIQAGRSTFLVEAEGYTSRTFSVDSRDPAATEVSLEPLGMVNAIVLKSDASPVSNAEIKLFRVVKDSSNNGVVGVPIALTTDENGRVLFAELPAASYLLAVQGTTATIEIEIDRNRRVHELELEVPIADLEGRVSDGVDLMEGVVVLLIDEESGHALESTITDQNGRYSFHVSDSERYSIVAVGESLGIARLENQFAGGLTPDLVPGGHQLSLSIMGNVNSAPARARVAPEGHRFGGAAIEAEPDENGEVFIKGLPAGTYEISILQDGFGFARHEVTISKPETHLSVTMPPEIIYRGTVRDESGTGTENVFVTALHESSGMKLFGLTDGTGNYEIRGLVAGSYSLAYVSHSFSPIILNDVNLTRDFESVVGSDVVMSIENDPVSVQLAFRESDIGSQFETALVNVKTEDGVILSSAVVQAPIDATATFHLGGLPLEDLTVEVTVSGRKTSEVILRPPRSDTPTVTIGPPKNVVDAIPATIDHATQEQFEKFVRVWYLGGFQRFRYIAPDGGVTSEFRQRFKRLGGPEKPEVAAEYQDMERWYRTMARAGAAANAAWMLIDAKRLTGFAPLFFGKIGGTSYLTNLVNAATTDINTYLHNQVKGNAGKHARLIEISEQTLIKIQALSAQYDQALVNGDVSKAEAAAKAMETLLPASASELQRLTDNSSFPVAQKFWSLLKGVKAINGSFDNLDKRFLEIMTLVTRMERNLEIYKRSHRLYDEAFKTYKQRLKEVCDEQEKPKNPCSHDNCKDQDSRAPKLLRAIDPNDIIGPTGVGPQRHLPGDQRLDYTILYENKAEATAPAQEVVITQQLDEDLDWATFELGDFGFGDLEVDVPDGRSHYETRVNLTDSLGFFVDFEAGIDLGSGVATWKLTSIDPETGDLIFDALAGFLPPNHNSPEGEGFVRYSIDLEPSLPTGREIDAQAGIVFDLNEAIITPDFVNTIDANSPTSSIQPLSESTGSKNISVHWSGSDNDGSGISSYDIFVSRDGGPFEPLLLDVSDTSTSFQGEFGHSYAFYSVATDNVGHEELPPTAAQVVTTLQPPTNNVVVDLLQDQVIIRGNSEDNKLRIQQRGPAFLRITPLGETAVDGSTDTLIVEVGLRRLVVLGQDGADKISLGQMSRDVFVDSAAGDDTVLVRSMRRGHHAEIETGTGNDNVRYLNGIFTGNVSLDTGSGRDVVKVDQLRTLGDTKISTGSGSDKVFVDNSLFAGNLSIDTGSNNDRVSLERNGTPGGRTRIRGKLNIQTGGGRDRVEAGKRNNAAYGVSARVGSVDGGVSVDALDVGILGNPNQFGNHFGRGVKFDDFENIL